MKLQYGIFFEHIHLQLTLNRNSRTLLYATWLTFMHSKISTFQKQYKALCNT